MSEENNVVNASKMNKKRIWITAVLFAIIAIVVLAIFVPQSAKAKKLTEQLNLGARYLSELKYEQAEAAYLAVIEIDPKNVDAYLGLADVYLAQGEYIKAIDVLKDALEEIGEDSEEAEQLKDKLAEAKAKKAEENTQTPVPTNTPVPTGTPTPEPTVVENDGITSTFKWEVKEDRTIAITELLDKSLTRVEVPAEIEGKVVTEIGSWAFEYCQSVEILLPEGLQRIDGDAFFYCNNLTEIKIPDSVTYIGHEAFNGCGNLSIVYLPEHITNMAGLVFRGTPWLEAKIREAEDYVIINTTLQDTSKVNGSAVIPYGVTSMYYAFLNNKSVTDAIVPGTVKIVSEGAFRDCEALKSVTLEEGVQVIAWGAFENCVSLSRIVIPDSLNEISMSAFIGCTTENITVVCSENHAMIEVLKELGFISFEFISDDGGATETVEPTATPTLAPAVARLPESLMELKADLTDVTYVSANSGVLITSKNNLYGAIDYNGTELVPNSYEICWTGPDKEGYFCLGNAVTAFVFDSTGKIVYEIPEEEYVEIYDIHVSNGIVTYCSEWTDEPGTWCTAYDFINNKEIRYEVTVESNNYCILWETRNYITSVEDGVFYATHGAGVFKVSLDGTSQLVYENVFAENYPYGGQVHYWKSPRDGYGFISSKNDFTGQRIGLIHDETQEVMLLATEDFVLLNESSERYSTKFYYINGQYYANVGTQIVLQLKDSAGNTLEYLLLDFSKAEFETREVYEERVETLVSNIEDLVVARYNIISLGQSDRYLASDGERWFYINSSGQVLKTYKDASDFRNGYAVVIEEDGLAYVIDTEFHIVSGGYTADSVATMGDAFILTKEGADTILVFAE